MKMIKININRIIIMQLVMEIVRLLGILQVGLLMLWLRMEYGWIKEELRISFKGLQKDNYKLKDKVKQ